MQWRQPPDRAERLHTDVVEFGRGRSRSVGYLAHSDRVGPGVLVLDPRGEALADKLNEEGFTALVPRGPLEALSPGQLEAAASFLSENWHPRLGVVATGDAASAVLGSLTTAGFTLDVIALVEGRWTAAPPSCPLVGHFSAREKRAEIDVLFASVESAGHEVELYLYEETLLEPDGGVSASTAALIDARNFDALEYHLS